MAKFLVKHHDEREVPINSGMRQEQINVQVLCSLLEPDFERTGNPVMVMQAYDACMRVGLYPPLWVLTYIHAAFRMKFDQNVTFDRAFGFSAEGLGSARYIDPMEQRSLRARDRDLCLNVFRLEALGLKRTPACRAVAAHFERHANRKMGERQVRSILKDNEDVYSRERELIQAAVWTEAERRAMLKEFDAAGLAPSGK